MAKHKLSIILLTGLTLLNLAEVFNFPLMDWGNPIYHTINIVACVGTVAALAKRW